MSLQAVVGHSCSRARHSVDVPRFFQAYTDDVCADRSLPMDSKDCPEGRKAQRFEHQISTHSKHGFHMI